MDPNFHYDVFISYSQKDSESVQEIADRLRMDGLRVWYGGWETTRGEQSEAQIEEGLERSRVLVLCLSAHVFGTGWAALESQTLRFRDPLNKERRFIPLRLDDSLSQDAIANVPMISWAGQERENSYRQLLETCRPPTPKQYAASAVTFDIEKGIFAYVFGPNGKHAISGGGDHHIQLWDVESGLCLRVLEGHSGTVASLAWSDDQRLVISGSFDSTVRLWETETGRCLGVLKGHADKVWSVALSTDQRLILSGSDDHTVRLWDVRSGRCLRILEGHAEYVPCVAWSPDQHLALSGSGDNTVRLWNLEAGRCLSVLEGHTGWVRAISWSPDQRLALSGSSDKTVRLWDMKTGHCLRVLHGHSGTVLSVVWSPDQRLALSGSSDKTVRLWDMETGHCLRVFEGHTDTVMTVAWSLDGRRSLTGDVHGRIRMWDISVPVYEAGTNSATIDAMSTADEVQYTNAKVLLVGDTSSGKTGIAHRLITGEWRPSDGSTVGAWSTQWSLPDVGATDGREHEIWLWDFGGQADQRLVNLLYMDRAALILLLFNADNEDVLPGLREWQTAMGRYVPSTTPRLLVAGRVDAGFKASRAKVQHFVRDNGFSGYYETSAKDGQGCEDLRLAILNVIPWNDMATHTSPRIFKRIKDEIMKLSAEGQVLLTFKELREVLHQRLHAERQFTDETLQTVIGLLDGPGAVKELEYGTLILIQPEWVNAYAQAVIRTLRQDPSELGRLPLQSIAEGRLIFQTVGRDGAIEEMRRLPEPEERIVLREMERQLEDRGLCLRQGDKIVFPSHCGRDRPMIVTHPSVFVSYSVQGYLDDIYATLVVKLADSEAFRLKELWRDAADFETLAGSHHLGIKLTREAAGRGNISIYFAPGVTIHEQVIFANYIHAHLDGRTENTQRLRHYVCPHCHTSKGNPEVLMQKLLDRKHAATVECDHCERRFDLWDDMEKLFASAEVRAQVEGLQANDVIRLDARRKGKLLALEVAARISSADQKCIEIPGPEDEGIDMEVEFTDDAGRGTGKRLYLQLKSGNSYLTKLKSGAEIFKIKEQRWVDYWLKQPESVMLVIGTFTGEGEQLIGKDKLEFTDVRWMEISNYLRRESENGKKPVKQIVFEGERLDLTSVRRWRDKALRHLRSH